MLNNCKPIDNNNLLDKPELHNLRLLFGLNVFLLVVLYVMPQYFGIHIGWDITCSRFANILLVFYSLLSFRVFNLFTKSFLRCSITIPLCLYLLVATYTMIFRADINAFMLVFLEILTLYMLVFAIRYVIGIRLAIRIIIGCAYFLSVYGFLEFVAGHSLYLQFLKTVPTAVVNCYRSGFYRIMGPCGHPLGYGLLLILFVAIACLDYEKDEIFLYKRPILLIMLVINTFLTGSRSSQGLVAIEIILIILLSKGYNRKKAIFYTIALIFLAATFLAVTYNTRLGRYLLMQITMMIDQVFGTEISANFGADITTLKNSEDYREFLPYIFTLDWLNPLIGRGIKRGFAGQVFDSSGHSAYINSVDCFYICQYIKYAYPGLFAYVAFIITTVVSMIRGILKYKSDTMKLLLVGIVCYFVNLWWVDALQTQKFAYIFIALFFALLIYNKDSAKNTKDGTN